MTSAHRELANSHGNTHNNSGSGSGIITSSHREHPNPASQAPPPSLLSQSDHSTTTSPSRPPFRGLMPGASGGSNESIVVRHFYIAKKIVALNYSFLLYRLPRSYLLSLFNSLILRLCQHQRRWFLRLHPHAFIILFLPDHHHLLRSCEGKERK